MKSIFLVILAGLAVISCSKSENNGGQTKTQAPVVVTEPEVATIRLEKKFDIKEDGTTVGSTSFLNNFQIIAKVENQKSQKLSLVCTDLENEKIIQDFSNNEAIVEIELAQNDPNLHEYDCEVVNEDNKSLVLEKIRFKKNYLVVGNQKASDLGLIPGKNDIGILFIYEQSSLITEGIELSINATVLVGAKGSSIQTFSKNDLNSPENTPGKSGGTIIIDAKKTFGELSVHMRGQNAGANTNFDDSYFMFNYRKLDFCPEYNTQEKLHLFSGKIILLDSVKFQKNFETDGPEGLPGGDTGFFQLASKNSQIKINFFKEPGLGGTGGFTSNPKAAISLQYTDAIKYPNYTKLGEDELESLAKLFKYDFFDKKCHAFVRMEKPVPSLQKKDYVQGETGKNGEIGLTCHLRATSEEIDCI